MVFCAVVLCIVGITVIIFKFQIALPVIVGILSTALQMNDVQRKYYVHGEWGPPFRVGIQCLSILTSSSMSVYYII